VSEATGDAPEAARALSDERLARWRAVQAFAVCIGLLCIAPIVLFTCGAKRRVKRSYPWTRRFCDALRRVAGIRVSVSGTMPPEGVLLAPNHQGYVDILALGSTVPCFFVAKTEVASWPLVGWLFRCSQQIAVPRKRTRGLVRATELMEERLRRGFRVCAFLEATTSGGDRIMPFFAPLVEPAIRADAPVVPVGIRWYADDPDIDIAEDVAYWKDHAFNRHVWRLLGLRGLHAVIRIGDPVEAAGRGRREAADDLRERVAELTELPMLKAERLPFRSEDRESTAGNPP
jgi:1-acyl-sn-glycerol-3-phosphate acyltransferase